MLNKNINLLKLENKIINIFNILIKILIVKKLKIKKKEGKINERIIKNEINREK